jgi:hypothetical protein
MSLSCGCRRFMLLSGESSPDHLLQPFARRSSRQSPHPPQAERTAPGKAFVSSIPSTTPRVRGWNGRMISPETESSTLPLPLQDCRQPLLDAQVSFQAAAPGKSARSATPHAAPGCGSPGRRHHSVPPNPETPRSPCHAGPSPAPASGPGAAGWGDRGKPMGQKRGFLISNCTRK